MVSPQKETYGHRDRCGGKPWQQNKGVTMKEWQSGSSSSDQK